MLLWSERISGNGESGGCCNVQLLFVGERLTQSDFQKPGFVYFPRFLNRTFPRYLHIRVFFHKKKPCWNNKLWVACCEGFMIYLCVLLREWVILTTRLVINGFMPHADLLTMKHSCYSLDFTLRHRFWTVHFAGMHWTIAEASRSFASTGGHHQSQF